MQVINSILNMFNGLLNSSKKLNLKKLPSQGRFYHEDFELRIKKADLEDIIDYEYNFDKDNIFLVVESLKKVVRKNTILSKGYVFEDIKSVDLVFLFLEIVRFTNNKKINVQFYNTKSGQKDLIEFNSDTFNYFDFSKYKFDEDTKEILIQDYRFSMPSIGIENCLTFYLADKITEQGDSFKNYFYDFLFFTGNKNYLSKSELDNLVTIFNFDIEDSEKEKIKKIVNHFMQIVGYTLKLDGEVIEIKTKIDLQTIWKS
jgi:hypothetical protein